MCGGDLMAIIRKPLKSKQFTQVPNHWGRDPSLSMQAFGLLSYICGHTADYELTVEQVVREFRDGKHAVLSAMLELEERGYLIRHTRRKSGRFAEYDYEVVEFPRPATDADFQRRKTRRGKSASKKTTRENTTGEHQGSEAECTTSGRSAPCGGGPEEASDLLDDPWKVPDSDDTPRPRTDWRTQDRNTFRDLLGDKIESKGVNGWYAGTFPINAIYDGLRTKGKKPMRWPGQYLSKLCDENPSGGLENWLDEQGFTPA